MTCCQTCFCKNKDLANFELEFELRTNENCCGAILDSTEILLSNVRGSITRAEEIMDQISMKPSLAGVIFFSFKSF